MTLVAFIADVHLGNHKRFGGPVESGINRRCRQALTTLEAAITLARSEGADTLVVLGDLFDSVRPEPQLVAETQRIFAAMPSTLVLMGNHDMVSAAPGDHALGPLAPVGGLFIVDRPAVHPVRSAGIELVLVPFRPGPAREWLADDVDQLLAGKAPTAPRVLCLHLGLENPDTPHFLKGAPDSIRPELLDKVMDAHGIAWAVAGNWHSRRYIKLGGGRSAFQCGTLVPTGWDNPGMDNYGTLALFDASQKTTDQLGWIEVPGPRFVTATDTELATITGSIAGEAGWALYARRPVGDTAELGPVARSIDEAVAAGVLAGGEVKLDDVPARAAAQQAAAAARSAGTLREAVIGYIEHQEAEEEDRAWATDYCLRALGV